MSASKPEWKCETEEIGQSEKQYPRNTLYDSQSKTVRRKIFKDRKGVLKETIDIVTGVKRTIFGKIPNLALPKDWTLEELTDSNESVNSADSIDIGLLSDHSKEPRAPSPKKNASRNSSSKNTSRSSSPKENQFNESSILRDSGLSPSEKLIGEEGTPTIYSGDAEDDHSKEPRALSSEKNASRNSSSKNASRSSSPKENQYESSILRDSGLLPSEKIIGDEKTPTIYSDDADDLHALSSENLAGEKSNEPDQLKEPRAPPSSKNASRSSSPKDNQLNESSILKDSQLSHSEKTTGVEEIPKIHFDDAEDLQALLSENIAEDESNESDHSKEPRAPPSSKNASRSSSPKDNQFNESLFLTNSEETIVDEKNPKIYFDDAEDLHALSSENLAEEGSNESDNSSPKKTRDSVGTKPQKCDENDYSDETGKSEIGNVDKVWFDQAMEAVKKVLDNLFGKHKTMEDRVKKVVEDVYEKYNMRFYSRKEDRHVAFNDTSFHRNESIQQNFTPCHYHQSLGQCVHTEFDWDLFINQSLSQCVDQEFDSRLSPTLPIQSCYGTRGDGIDSQNIDDQLIELLKLTEVPTINCHYDDMHPCFMVPMSLR